MKQSYTWQTEFKSIIIVDQELYSNEYDVVVSITPITADLKEQNQYFERLKSLFGVVFNNTIICQRGNELHELLKINSKNRFVELPKPPFDQVMAAVAFSKANAIMEGKIQVDALELGSYQGDGIAYTVEPDGIELSLLEVDNWFSTKYDTFDPWWLRSDTATYDRELEKGIYTGHFTWQPQPQNVFEKKEKHAKVFEFNPKVLDGGKDKNK